jgi:hypothetical protein
MSSDSQLPVVQHDRAEEPCSLSQDPTRRSQEDASQIATRKRNILLGCQLHIFTTSTITTTIKKYRGTSRYHVTAASCLGPASFATKQSIHSTARASPRKSLSGRRGLRQLRGSKANKPRCTWQLAIATVRRCESTAWSPGELAVLRCCFVMRDITTSGSRAAHRAPNVHRQPPHETRMMQSVHVRPSSWRYAHGVPLFPCVASPYPHSISPLSIAPGGFLFYVLFPLQTRALKPGCRITTILPLAFRRPD